MAEGEDWKLAVAEDMRPQLEKFKDVGELAKSYIEIEKFRGQSIRPPGPDAAPEEKEKFLTDFTKRFPELVYTKDEKALLAALGTPEKPDGYSVPTDLGEVPDEVIANWRETAKELGLTKRQAEAAIKKQVEGWKDQNEGIAEARAELKRDWGAALEERTRLAAVAAEKLGFPAESIEIIKSGKGAANEMKAFYKAAEALGLNKPGNPMGQDGPGAQPGGMTPLEVRMRVDEIRKRPEYWESRKNPELHRHLVAEVVRLNGMLPEGS